MITGNNNILAYYDATVKANKNASVHWLAYPLNQIDKGNLLARSTDDESLPFDVARQELKDFLSIFKFKFTLVIPKAGTSKSNRGDFIIAVEPQSENAVSGFTAPYQQAQVQGISEDEVNKKIQEALNQYKTEERLKALEEENRELKKELKSFDENDPVRKIAGILMPMAPQIINRMFPAAAVAGFPEQQPAPATAALNNEQAAAEQSEIILSDDENARLSHVIDVFSKIDPDWLTTLEKMADKLQSNPSLLPMFKSML